MTHTSNCPNIFVVGTMKGGTTALHRILTSHPEVHSGSQKEIHYFSLHYANGDEWYESHFDGLPTGQNYVDASPTYLDVTNTPLMPRLINNYNPDGKVIVIARNPVERAISHFHHLQRVNKLPVLQEMDCTTFFSHEINKMFPGIGPLQANFMNVLNFSCYVAKVEKYRSVFGERLLILDNSQLRSAPQETIERVFQHVGVDPIWNRSFTEIQHSHQTKLTDISPAVFERLSDLLRPDYEKFCRRFDIPFN
ncbi:sulfotransferase [Aliiroseovarius sediminis]|uniref:sulfotransferase family protein n=1 Tax=Aliiroseovarius sediminis TaxID=2925839 RepID=UPI001F5648E7|nr:sulfotransferase [Aliiroseovarius sediminis]MCI2395570.1 sulfotransferase domain-containing protein [Aliiroseovarius sediminis]